MMILYVTSILFYFILFYFISFVLIMRTPYMHSFKTRPGHRPGPVIGLRVRWVDPGQPKKKMNV
jgi:hypothetical protein